MKNNFIILQETNISHLRKREIIFKSALVRDMLVPKRVILQTFLLKTTNSSWLHQTSRLPPFMPRAWGGGLATFATLNSFCRTYHLYCSPRLSPKNTSWHNWNTSINRSDWRYHLLLGVCHFWPNKMLNKTSLKEICGLRVQSSLWKALTDASNRIEWWNTFERPKQSQKLAYYCRISYIHIYIYYTADSTCKYHLYKTTLLGAVRVRTTVGQKHLPASPAGQLDLVAGLQRSRWMFGWETMGKHGKPNRGMSCESAYYIKSGRIACLFVGFFHGKLTWFTATNATGSIGTLSLRDILSFFKRRQQRTVQMKSAKHGTIHFPFQAEQWEHNESHPSTSILELPQPNPRYPKKNHQTTWSIHQRKTRKQFWKAKQTQLWDVNFGISYCLSTHPST